LLTIHFKDVGQGDSIILEWYRDGVEYLGIVDCHRNSHSNPTLEYLKKKGQCKIEFILLSHLHYDHYSGMAEVLIYCRTNQIKVNYFYHTIGPYFLELYNKIFTSKKIEKTLETFISEYDKFDRFIVIDQGSVTSRTGKLQLTDSINMSFLAPAGKTYEIFTKQLSRKINKIVTTSADLNKLATIILLHNESSAALLTSDAAKQSYAKIKEINRELKLIQVPHHGSWENIRPLFWKSLQKADKCPAVFSVGDEPKDKLPNENTVAYFEQLGYDIFSTNQVYGIAKHFKLPGSYVKSKKGTSLNSFSKLRATMPAKLDPKYSGDQKFTIF